MAQAITRNTGAPLHPAKPWGSFPMSVVNWESKDMFRDYFFSENVPETAQTMLLFASPIVIISNSLTNEIHIQIKGRSSLKTDR